MRRYLLALAAMPLVMPAAAQAQAVDWSGPYAGLHVGYATGKADLDNRLGGAWASESTALQGEVTAFTSRGVDPKGGVFGAQIGYNIAAGGNAVVGIEADAAVSNADDDRLEGPTPTVTFPSLSYTAGNRVDVKSMLSVRARAGLAFGNTLAFIDGGYAWTRARYRTSLSSNGGYAKAADEKETNGGFIIGAGLEHMVGSSVSLRADYSYTNQGDADFDSVYLPGSTFVTPAYTESYSQDLKLHIVRLGVNFHF